MSLLICSLLLVVHSSLFCAGSSAIPVDQVVAIQKCVCTAQATNAACCDAASSQLDLLQVTAHSLLDVVVDVLEGISDVDIFISQYEILVNIAQSIDVNLVKSLVNIIFSTGSSFEHISSLIDSDTVIDETILSKVSAIDTNAATVTSLVDDLIIQNCASTSDLIISGLDQLADAVQSLEVLFAQISEIDDVIVSTLDDVTTKINTAQSALEILADQGCNSLQDAIVSSLEQLQQQEASCCQQLSLQLTDLQVDVDTRLENIGRISFIDQLLGVMSAVDNLEGLFTSYIDISQSGFDHISSQLDALSECAPVPVIAPITITVPGNYCLSADASGDITIAVSDVALNLNNRALSGSITINAGLENISIKNGRLNGSGVNYGITININCSNIILSDLYIANFLVGVGSLGSIGVAVNNLYIDAVSVVQSSLNGYQIQETTGVMTNSVAFGNTDGGINVANTNTCFTIINSQVISNGSFGFQVVGGANFSALSAEIYDSFAYANSNSPGFVFSNCTMYVQNCLSQNNGVDGFFVNNASPSTVQGSIINCKALNNGRGGFNVNNNKTLVRYIGNYSTGNSIFAYGVNGAFINFNVAPYYWLDSNSSTVTGYNNVNGQ